MKYGKRIQATCTIRVLALTTGVLMASAAFAQGTPTQSYPAQAPSYPAQAPSYPTQTPGYPAQTQAYPSYPAPAAAPPRSHAIRDLFAGTIAAVLQTASAGLVTGLSGSIQHWFARKQGPGAAPAYGAPAYPAQDTQGYANSAYTATGAYPSGTASTYPTPSANYPGTAAQHPSGGAQYPGTASTYPSTTAQYPGATYPTTSATTSAATGQVYGSTAGSYGQPSNQAQSSAYSGSTTSAYGGAQVYDARTGQLATSGTNPYATAASGYDGTLYAGIAYEVHALGADGSSTPINPATYVFRNGDKFMVYYRPSLPGRMEVYNINPAGQKTLIDSSNMAAGQMSTLGPYQFANLPGDESLRLVLTPCSSPQLLAATRDIVRADSGYQAATQASPTPSSGGQLSACSATSTRGLDVHTRDIQKVAVDGTTSYALDPVSQRELTTGQVTPREANIVFHHR